MPPFLDPALRLQLALAFAAGWAAAAGHVTRAAAPARELGGFVGLRQRLAKIHAGQGVA